MGEPRIHALQCKKIVGETTKYFLHNWWIFFAMQQMKLESKSFKMMYMYNMR
jgi:hypothetical protein